MIQIKHKGVVHDIRNNMDEITIEEFEYITHLLTSEVEISTVDLWMDIFSVLNVDETLLDDLDIENFLEIVKSFDFTSYYNTIKQTIIIDEVEYKCYDDKFRLKVKDLSSIEAMINKGFYLSSILSFLYKREDYLITQNLDKTHINYKREFFKKQPASIVLPILDNINTLLIKKLNIINE